MNIIADTHTHTLASDHAYSTISENAKSAKEKGLSFLCHTEHTSSLPGSPTDLHFFNLRVLPRYINDVMIVRGAEVNIIDYDGTLDIGEDLLGYLEWKIASFHSPCISSGSKEQHTNAWLNISENPLINVIGHCGDSRYEFDHDVVLKSFANNNKIVEINSHSFEARPGTEKNCKLIAQKCMDYGISIVVSSDAHFHNGVGEFSGAIQMLKEMEFPEELILNADYNRFLAKLHEINNGKLKGEK